jgi:hypothetical protein
MGENCSAFENCCPSAPDISITNVTVTMDGAAVRFYQEAFLGSAITNRLVQLAHWPVMPMGVLLFLNTGIQGQNTIVPYNDYTISGKDITLGFTPDATDEILVAYMAYSAATAGSEAVGVTHAYAGATAPTGYVFMDGSTAYSIASFPALYAFVVANGLLETSTATTFTIKLLLSEFFNGTTTVQTATLIKV